MHRHATLNRIFRLVWSHRHQAWVAVAEHARGQGKRASGKLLLAALIATPLAQAGPTGGQVTTGTGAITQSGATTTINQSSANLSLRWDSFNTQAVETVNFVQPSRSAVAVNRIADTSATQFFGKLNANGQVYLINPNGVLFGASAQINVGGLVASTLDIDEQARDGAVRRFNGAGAGSIVNQGAITAADGGYVAFIGKQVGNHGTITAPRGSVSLGAGSDVTLSFAGNSLVSMQVNQGTLDNLAENGGLIRAIGGAVLLSAGARDAVLASVVNNTGIIEARSVRDVNGLIVLEGGQVGTVTNSGTLDASGRSPGATGGTVKVLGQEVSLAAASRIDVSGDAGGGAALVGGNFTGAGPELHAHDTSVAAGSTVLADAVASGAGGRVAVWSDGTTRFDGSISARGGAAGGDGGMVETSGKTLQVGVDARVDTLAPRGAPGNWLLDPQDLTIGEPGFGDPGDISGQQITMALNSSNVTIKTGPAVSCTGMGSCSPGSAGNGDITLLEQAWIGGYYDNQGVGVLWSAPTTLTLSAYRHVNVQNYAVIESSGGLGNIVLRADNTGTGTGTVNLASNSTIYGNDAGYTKIYYNPTSYATPTDYAGMQTSDGQYNVIVHTILSTYMLVNAHASVATKTYDGTTSATLTGLPTVRALPNGITIDTSGATAIFADKNAGANKATVVTGAALLGTNAGKYALNGLDSGTATINKANVAVTGLTANNKTYDGSATASLSGAATVAAFGGDIISVTGSPSASFATKNAGAGKPVTVSGFALGGTDAANYNLLQPAGLSANIARANLALSGVSANSKTYDGTTAATLSGSAGVSAFGSDAVTVGGTGAAAFADRNAGASKAVSVSGYTLGGVDAGNYNLVQPAGLVASVNKAGLAVSGIAALDKTYDGGIAATLTGSATVSAIGSDAVTVSGTGVGAFASKNAAVGKPVSVTGFTLGGLDAGNYNVVQPTGLAASIARANLALAGVSANSKTYDGTTAATLAVNATVSAFGSDVVSVAGTGAGAFTDKTAGLGKTVTVGGFALVGVDAGNYNLVPTSLSADIARASLVVSGVIANDKTYDGTVSASLGGAATVAAIGSDVVNVSSVAGGIGAFADKNAGTGKAVSASGFTLGGLDAGNYALVQPAGLHSSIGKASVIVAGVTASDKTYDGTVAATLGGAATVAAIGADAINVAGGIGAFADKNAGTGKAVSASGFTLGGLDAGNYTLVQPAGLHASIGKASLAVSGVTASDKVYDGTTAATLSGNASVAAFGSDAVRVAGGIGTFADKNAGAGKAVTVSGYTLAGADAGNYDLVAPTDLRATITPASLHVSGISASDKDYDGTTAATVSTAGAVLDGKIGADSVTVASTGAFADAAPGAGKIVRLSNAYGGADVGNYIVIDQATTLASIAGLPESPVPPVIPVIPVTPVQPVPPAPPEEPMIPVTPGEPVVPVIPVTPVTPVIPEIPQIPAIPVIPEIPVMPPIPVTPVPPVTQVPPAPPIAPVLPAAPTAPATTPPPAALPPATGLVRDAVVQVQTLTLAPQATTQPQSLDLASTLVVDANETEHPARGRPVDKAAGSLINTRFGAGPNAPVLTVQNGGVQLPPLASESAQ